MNLRDPDISALAQKKKDRDDIDLELKLLEDSTESQDFERMASLRSHRCVLEDDITVLEAKPTPQLTMENLAHII